MAIVRELYATFTGDGTTISSSQNVGTADSRFALVFARVGDGFTFTGASVGGQSLTELAYQANGLNGQDYAVYGGLITVSGTQTISVTNAAFGSSKSIRALVYSGVDSIRNAAIAFASSTAPSITLTTQSGDLCIIIGNDGGFGTTFTAASPAVKFVDSTGTISAEEEATTTSTIVNGTLSASGQWAIGGWALVPAGGGGGGSSIAAISNFYRMMRSS